MQIEQPILMKINSLDVLHSFYLPHFRVKMDAVPGIPTQFWFTPTKTTQQARDERDDQKFDFELACAELCGASVEADEFQDWKARQTTLYSLYGEKETDTQKAEKNNIKEGEIKATAGL